VRLGRGRLRLSDLAHAQCPPFLVQEAAGDVGGAGAAVAETADARGVGQQSRGGARKAAARMQAKLSSRPRGCGRSSAADPADAVAAGAAAARRCPVPSKFRAPSRIAPLYSTKKNQPLDSK